MRYLFIFLMVLLVLGPSQGAQADILGFFFPSLKKEQYNPYKTLKAPFANQSGDAEKSNRQTQVPLGEPHRTDNEIAQWLEDMVPEIMSFQNADYRADLQRKEKHFDQQGLVNFRDFLQSQNIMGVIESRQYNITTVIRDFPLLLNEGVVGGRYRWLYQVPVMITYMDKRARSYKESDPTNQYFELIVQVGRFNDHDADNEHHVLIETWTGKVVKGE